jgi:hypothetical protein
MDEIPDSSTRTDFYKFFDAVIAKYISKLPQYGESWRIMSHTDLRARVEQEYLEWDGASQDDTPLSEEAKELIDVTVCAFLLYTRLMEKKE